MPTAAKSNNAAMAPAVLLVFVRDKKLIGRDWIRVQTSGGNIELNIENNGEVTVDMGLPRLEPKQIPFDGEQRATTYGLNVDGKTLEVSAVSMGNPHCVYLVDDTHNAPVEHLGPLIEQHDSFPKKCNAGFMQVISPSEINLRVFERGVGETLACGNRGLVLRWLPADLEGYWTRKLK